MVGIGLQLSIAEAMPVSIGSVLSVHSTVIFGGQLMVGTWLSSSMIVCSQVLVLPQTSIAIHVLMIVISCGQDPPTITSLYVTVGAVSQLSVALALPVSAGSL